jgi:flavin prenyltransferase
MTQKRIVIGIGGASGALYALRTVRLLVESGVEVHMVVSALGQRLLHDELGLDTNDLAPFKEPITPAGKATGSIVLHNHRDVGATIASGSFRHDGMAVVPCSSNTMACIAHGMGDNLVHRAGYVTLKERRKLVLVHRETPLTLIDINNMASLTQAGAIICPANPGFYMKPKTIEDLADHMAARVADLLDVEHALDVRWKG